MTGLILLLILVFGWMPFDLFKEENEKRINNNKKNKQKKTFQVDISRWKIIKSHLLHTAYEEPNENNKKRRKKNNFVVRMRFLTIVKKEPHTHIHTHKTNLPFLPINQWRIFLHTIL